MTGHRSPIGREPQPLRVTVSSADEEREWHPRQTLRRRRIGEDELAFPAKGHYEVQRWVLS